MAKDLARCHRPVSLSWAQAQLPAFSHQSILAPESRPAVSRLSSALYECPAAAFLLVHLLSDLAFQTWAAQRLLGTRESELITPNLKKLLWLLVCFWIDFKVILWVLKRVNVSCPFYLSDPLLSFQPGEHWGPPALTFQPLTPVSSELRAAQTVEVFKKDAQGSPWCSVFSLGDSSWGLMERAATLEGVLDHDLSHSGVELV